MKKLIVTLIFFVLLLLGCSTDISNQINVTQTQFPSATLTYTPASSKTPASQPTPTEYILDYEIVYSQDSFFIQQAYIGSKDSLRQYDIPIPKGRVNNLDPDIEIEWVEYSSPTKEGFYFGKIISIPAANNLKNVFTLDCKALTCNGNAVLRKNGEDIWSGHMNGGLGFAFHSILGLDGEIILEYSDSNWGNGETEFWKKDFIIRSDENRTTIIESAFFPYIINDQLIYFQRKNGLSFLYFNDQLVGVGYEYIVNRTSGGYTLRDMRSDGKMIDFFALINNDWYHVQAGFEN